MYRLQKQSAEYHISLGGLRASKKVLDIWLIFAMNWSTN